MPLINLKDLEDPRLRVFSEMTDSELRDPKQMVGLSRAVTTYDAAYDAARGTSAEPAGETNCGEADENDQEDGNDAEGAGEIEAGESRRKGWGGTLLEEGKSAEKSRRAQNDNPNRLENGLFIAESKNVIERALANGLSCFSLFVEDCWAEQSEQLIERLLERDPRTPVFTVTHRQMQQVTGYQTTRGPLAAFHRPPLPDPAELLAGARRVAVLEDIRNFTNVGAIFRSAAALGIDAVLVTPNCHDPFYRRAARVSMGTVFQVPWTRIGSNGAQSWTEEGLPLLRAAGFATAALALSDDSIPLQDRRLQSCDKLALVLGTEGDGLAETTIAACDYTVRIPMDHEVDSLNVAAASAVAFWELRTKHRG